MPPIGGTRVGATISKASWLQKNLPVDLCAPFTTDNAPASNSRSPPLRSGYCAIGPVVPVRCNAVVHLQRCCRRRRFTRAPRCASPAPPALAGGAREQSCAALGRSAGESDRPD
jgi:hypothetical protein